MVCPVSHREQVGQLGRSARHPNHASELPPSIVLPDGKRKQHKLFHQDLPDLIIEVHRSRTLHHFCLHQLPRECSPSDFERTAWLRGGCDLQLICCQRCREEASRLLPTVPLGTKTPFPEKAHTHQERERDGSGVILSRIFLVYSVMSQIVNQPLLILGKLQVSAQLTVPGADKSRR